MRLATFKETDTVLGRRITTRFAIAICIVLLLLAGCAKNTEPDQEPAEEPVVGETEPEPDNEPDEPEPPPFTYPLTGVGTEEEITHRPIVVLVENSPNARPQSGLDQADIVYEILAEGDITRFVAVFQSEEPEVIGPVRSIRPYFVEIGDALDALVVHAGWSQEAMNLIVERGLNHFDAVYGDHDFYWRSSDRYAPHNLYTSIEKIWEGAEVKNYRTDEWDDPIIMFADPPAHADASGEGASGENASGTTGSDTDAGARSDHAGTGTSVRDGQTASTVHIPYIGGYHVSYVWDGDAQHYRRMMLGEEHQDRESGETLVAHNLLVLRSSHQIVDDVGRRHVNVTGPGEGYLVQQGEYKEITWQQVDGIIRVFEHEQEQPWLPGKTWIQIVPLSSDVQFE